MSPTIMFSLAVLACLTCTVKDRNFRDHAWFTMVMSEHFHFRQLCNNL